jgi:hypothetical protein
VSRPEGLGSTTNSFVDSRHPAETGTEHAHSTEGVCCGSASRRAHRVHVPAYICVSSHGARCRMQRLPMWRIPRLHAQKTQFKLLIPDSEQGKGVQCTSQPKTKPVHGALVHKKRDFTFQRFFWSLFLTIQFPLQSNSGSLERSVVS